jgi:hypothetical protein
MGSHLKLDDATTTLTQSSVAWIYVELDEETEMKMRDRIVLQK